MVRLLEAVFECSLGSVSVCKENDKELQKAFNWFRKRYPCARIKSIKEVYYDGERKQ